MAGERVLVTGASGFIGRSVVRQLAGQGYDVVAACHGGSQPEQASNIAWKQADLLDERQVDRLVSAVQPELLLHLAWNVNAATYWHTEENLDWLSASISLLQSCVSHGCRRIVTAGTSAEYTPADHPLRETDAAFPNGTLYAACKHSLYEIGAALCKRADVSYAHGRVFYLYGPHEKKERVFPYVICNLLTGRPAKVSFGSQARDYLHVDDVASAFAALLPSQVSGAVNISSGSGVRLKDCFLMIQQATGAPKELLRFGEAATSANEPPLIAGDNRILVHDVGWRPQFSIQAGLEQTVAWWAQQIKR